MSRANQSARIDKRSLLLICSHPLLREALSSLFSQDEDLYLTGVVADVSGALEILRRKRPDAVVILHVSGYQHCVSIVEQVKLGNPALPVLVISTDLNCESVQAVLQAGAIGYLSIDASQDEFVHGVDAVSRGETFIESPILINLVSCLTTSSSGKIRIEQEDFSPREQEILSCLTRGMSDRDMAQSLFISVRTVQTHLAHIYEKMGVHSRTEAALTALHTGWLSSAENRAADIHQNAAEHG